jgi:hypothetical protein
MRPVASLCLLYSMKVSDDYLAGSPSTHRLGMIPGGLFVAHVPMPKKAISKLPPTILKIIVDNLAPHTFSLIGDLCHYTAR